MSFHLKPDTSENTMNRAERSAACSLRFAGLAASISIVPDVYAPGIFHCLSQRGTLLVGHRQYEAPWILPPHSFVYSVFSAGQEALLSSTDGYDAETTVAFLNTHLA